MKKGDIVKIYQKPISKEDFEGEAKLIRCVEKSKYGNGTGEFWIVKFGLWATSNTFQLFDSDPTVGRWIYE
jgi:hypothetical protein